MRRTGFAGRSLDPMHKPGLTAYDDMMQRTTTHVEVISIEYDHAPSSACVTTGKEFFGTSFDLAGDHLD
jgi:peptide methionine sulfoxide reductase MsrA